MTKELIQSYTMRVTSASRTELIVILYEIILIDIDSSKEAFRNKDYDSYVKELKHASKCLNELMGSLDYRYEISYQLMSLYIYVNKVLTGAMFKKEISDLNSATSVISKLSEGFKIVCKQDNTGPVMQNVQQLYAGLTYGKGTLDETSIDPLDMNRGYKA